MRLSEALWPQSYKILILIHPDCIAEKADIDEFQSYYKAVSDIVANYNFVITLLFYSDSYVPYTQNEVLVNIYENFRKLLKSVSDYSEWDGNTKTRKAFKEILPSIIIDHENQPIEIGLGGGYFEYCIRDRKEDLEAEMGWLFKEKNDIKVVENAKIIYWKNKTFGY